MEQTVKQRLIKFLKYEQVSQSKFEKRIGVSNGFVNNIVKGIGADKMQRISSEYPQLNTEWLLYGKGDMLIPQSIHASHSTVVGSKIQGSGIHISHNDLSDIKLLVDEMAEQRKANTVLMQKKDEQLDKAQSQIDRLLDLLERK